jgi:hypothetical protein
MQDSLTAALSLVPRLSDPTSLSPEQIAAFIDGRVSGDERAMIEAYLADNPAARAEVVEAARIVAAMPGLRASKMRFAPAAAIAAAAVFAIVLFRPGSSETGSAPRPAERRGVAEHSRAIEMVSPLEGGALNSHGAFTWHSVDGGSYTIFILDESGKTIFQGNTTDTVQPMPAAVLKNGAGRYYWSVDALMSDGSSVTSGAREFVINPR